MTKNDIKNTVITLEKEEINGADKVFVCLTVRGFSLCGAYNNGYYSPVLLYYTGVDIHKRVASVGRVSFLGRPIQQIIASIKLKF